MRFNLSLLAGILLAILFFSAVIWAGTTGKITGVATDKGTGEPLMAANVELIDPGTGEVISGTSTGLDGEFLFMDVRPRIYDLRASSVGYQPILKKNVVVHSDKTTTVDFKLTWVAIEAPPIEVIESRVDALQPDLTTTTKFTTAEDLKSLPVNSVTEAISTNPGVILGSDGQLHFRGGRAREVKYEIEGMPAQDPTYGNRAISVSTNAVQEIRVQTGTFNAEYGGALSAIVSIITKEGNPNKFSGSAGYSTTNLRVDALNKFTTNADKLDFSLSGQEPITGYLLPLVGLKMPRDKRISYFLSVSGENTDTRVPYNKVFDLDYEEGGAPIATLDEIYGPYKIDYGWYGFFPERRYNQYQTTLKLKQQLTPSLRYVLSYTGNWWKWRGFTWYYYFCPSFSPVSYQESHQANISVTHNLSTKTFYEARIGYMHTERTSTPADMTPGDFAIDSSSHLTLDEWVDVNGDGIGQVRIEWWDANSNGMWDYGEHWVPTIERIDTIWQDPVTRAIILEVDTVYADTLPPQVGEEPWVDWNNNGVFEPRMTNYNSPLYGYYALNLGEPFMDGEPYLDGFPCGLNYLALLNGMETYEGQLIYFEMDTLWVDINSNGRKDFGEFVFGSSFRSDPILLEELTWEDANENQAVDWGEFTDINGDGQYTMRDSRCNYIDANGNGYYDVGELGEPFIDINGNGRYDPANGWWNEFPPDSYSNAMYPAEPFLDRNGNGTFTPFSDFQYRGYDRWAMWHKRSSDVFMVKGDITSQVDRNNMIKSGIDFQWISMDMNEIQYPEFRYDGDPDGMPWPNHGIFRSFYKRTPMTFAAYVQDKMEYGGLIANIGLRFDVFIQAHEVLEDSTADEIRAVLEDWWPVEESTIVSNRVRLSPRLGMSYPITDRSKLFFSYGHFYQMPGLDNVYRTPTQGSRAARLMGNPNLSYEKTIGYELGVAYSFADNWTAQFSGYYKDIYDLLNTSQQRVGPLEQDVYVNHDYARTRGLELRVDKLLYNYWALSLNYSFAFAYGKSSSERSSYNSQFDQSAIPLRDLPLDWDQRHLLNAIIDLRARKEEHPKLFGLTLPDQWGLNFVITWGSGFPYTPSKYNPKYEIKPGEKAWERTNALRMPNQFNINMKFNKEFRVGRMIYSCYAIVENMTNYRTVLSVYEDTGEPDKSWVNWIDDDTYEFMESAAQYSSNPLRWGQPTEIKLGLEMAW